MTILNRESLRLDCEAEVDRIVEGLRRWLTGMRRRGLVVGLSGGIDSSVTAALAVRAVGKERVFGLHMPERDSAPETLRLSQLVSSELGLASAVEEITDLLRAAGCYERQAEAVRRVLPDFESGWRFKLVLEQAAETRGYHYFNVVVQPPGGSPMSRRLSLDAYLGVVAATNFKQRIRKMLEYYHADRLNYAVAGTPNRLEYDQGFFVKLGDGAADVKPIAHLYKTQVYQLADFLGLPAAVRNRPPTTDTYSLPQGQDEFFFTLPYPQLDLCLYAKNHGVAPELAAPVVGLSADQVRHVYAEIDTKRAATRYLHAAPHLVGDVPEIGS